MSIKNAEPFGSAFKCCWYNSVSTHDEATAARLGVAVIIVEVLNGRLNIGTSLLVPVHIVNGQSLTISSLFGDALCTKIG